jgi:TRAP-type C4-dicarboxylate transport system permease small subunit
MMDVFTPALIHLSAGLRLTPVLADASTDAITTSIDNLIKLAQLVTAAVCGGMLCVGGFNYATSAGNPIKMERAKHTLTMAAVGIAIVLLSMALGTTINNAISVPSST